MARWLVLAGLVWKSPFPAGKPGLSSYTHFQVQKTPAELGPLCEQDGCQISDVSPWLAGHLSPWGLVS